MHDQAYEWVRRYAPPARPLLNVLDIGGRDINGSVKPLFPDAAVYRVLDIADGPNVDIVADAATWVPDMEYDIVVACEVFEHTQVWPQICATAYKACVPFGLFIATMAGPGRPAHSAVDGEFRLHPGEHYANVDPHDLHKVLVSCGWSNVIVDQQQSPADVRAVAWK